MEEEKTFQKNLQSQGIIMQTTARYTPQQNGVVERKKIDYNEHGKEPSRREISVKFILG